MSDCKTRGIPAPWARRNVGLFDNATLDANEVGCAKQLARFFPETQAVRIPIHVSSSRGEGTRLREATVVEFGGKEHAIFLSTLPLEFNDRVQLEADRKEGQAEATVVAVQLHEGRKAVAVRLSQGSCDWVVTQP